MVKLQSLSSEECGVLFYSYYSQVHWLNVVVPVRILSIGQMELFNQLTEYKLMTLNWIVSVT